MSNFERFSLTIARWLTHVYDEDNPAESSTNPGDVAPDSFNSPHDDYLGPWNLHRCDPRHPVIANISTEPAELVRTTYRSRAGGGGGGGPSGVDRVALWGTVAPDEEFNLCLCDEPAVHTVEVTLAWFGPESPFEQSWSFDTSSANDQPWSGSPC